MFFSFRYALRGECNMQKLVSDRLPELFETPPEMKLYPDSPP
jgi:hypothetical protein